MLIILAGITLNAVIGEDGIIFQAKDTKNMITNETAYDNEQLAQLQNELKDNSIYTGIGIIPGTDSGGSSEGGESGSGGTGGSGSTGGTNTGTGGTGSGGTTGGGSVSGDNAQQPTIQVLEGEEIAANFYRSDVTIQILTADKTQNIKYILTTTVEEINNELYPSGLVKEIDIANGGTLTFTKDGEYTITAYAYDVYGQKSEATIMWLKRETGGTSGSGVTVDIASGNIGENGWYTSNVTLRVLGTDREMNLATYRIRGTAHSNGTIGNAEHGEEIVTGDFYTDEITIANGTTFQIALDGEFAIVAYTYKVIYDENGAELSRTRLSTSTTVNVKRDASRPVIKLYKGEQVVGSGFQITMEAEDSASQLATTNPYKYRHKLAADMNYTDIDSNKTTQLYTELLQNKTYDMYMIVTDQAGNKTASDMISKPALWITNTPTVGDTVSGGVEGARKYCSTDVDISMTGQDENNVDISRVTYQILGTTTGAGTMDGTSYSKGVALTEDEIEIGNEKSIQIRVDGNWTFKIHTYNKENVRVSTNTFEVTRDTVTPEPPVIEVTAGTEGESTYYRSNITIKLTSADDTCYKKTTYIVTGTPTGNGTIGSATATSGTALNTGEVEIGNGKTFTIAADGTWTIKGYTYDKAGRKSALATGIVVTRDTVAPTISSFVTNTAATTTNANLYFTATVTNTDFGVSGQATGGGYTYYLDGVQKTVSSTNTYQYTGLTRNKSYTVKAITKDKAGNTSEKTANGYTYVFLVDMVAVGDYVAYDAGTWPSGAQSGTGWTSNTTTATTNGHFSGYTAGANKGTSIAGSTSGWRVLSKSGSGSTGTVTLIHAGSPANAYKAGNSSTNQSGMVTALDNFASANYLNTTYASSARNMTTGDYGNAGTAGTRNISSLYWLSTAHTTHSTTVSGSSCGTRYWYYYNGSNTYYFYYGDLYRSISSNGYYYGVYVISNDGYYYPHSVSLASRMDFLQQQCLHL